jgi:hypothetical protein
MAWSTTRLATEEDEIKLQAVMDRFSARHDVAAENVLMVRDDGSLSYGSDLMGESDHRAFSPEYALKLRRYLCRNIQRAIGGEGIAYGHVGCHVD